MVASNGSKKGVNQKQKAEEVKNSDKPTSNADVEPPQTGWTGPIPSKEGGSEEGYLFKPPYAWTSKEFEVTYTASCLCGKIHLEYSGDPLDAKHCHCKGCQRSHGAPFQWAVLFHKTSVRMLHTSDPMYLKFFSTQEMHSDHVVPCKVSCRNCGSHLFDEGKNMIMAYPSSFEFKDGHVPASFAPTCHIFYGERTMDLHDDVPKWSGHKEKSDLMPDSPEDDRTFGLGKRHKTDVKATKSEQSPRRPSNLPAGMSSLSERIAALQKKNSTNGTSGSSSLRSSSANPVIAGSTSASSSSSSNYASNLLSPTSPSTNRSISTGSQAVKDRIARFQQHDKPLLPKSSLGTPSPMDTGRQSNAVRAYPGANASGSGSGNWGENILRPQLTGGTWVGAGEGKGWTDGGSIRPQLTGSAWLGVGGSPAAGNSTRLSGQYTAMPLRSPTRQRDAFLDLEDEARLSASPQKRESARRGSSFSEAQMAAASKGLSRTPSNAGSERGSSPVNEKREANVQSTLSTLPDTPSKSLPFLTLPKSDPSLINGTDAVSVTRTLPSPPIEAPVTIAMSPPRDVRTSGDIEIGIGGAPPAKMRDLQRTLSGSHSSIIDSDVNADSEKIGIAGPIPTAPILQDFESTMEPITVFQTETSSDDGAYDIGRLATRSDTEETEAPSSGPASAISPPANIFDLLAISSASQHNREEEKVEEEPDDMSNVTAGGSSEADVIESNVVDNRNLETSHSEQSQDESAISDGTLTATNSLTTVAASNSAGDTSLEAQRRAKEAILIARSKSQRVKKPPVGRPMTVAEMDASDDEYEPGWASVISTYSNRT